MALKYILILFAGIIASFINVNAGGGSLITIPALIFLGLPPAVANGTNRIAILLGAVSASSQFKRKNIFDLRSGIELAIPAAIGAIIGSMIVIQLPDRVFTTILSIVMVAVMIAVVVRPKMKVKHHASFLMKHQRILCMIAFFFVGLYGGFIQAGVGFLIMAALALLTNYSLLKINSLKVLIVGIYTIFAIIVFALNGKIDLISGLVLSVGNIIGAYLGTHMAIAKGDNFIKVIFVIAVLAMALKLSGLLN